MGEQCSGDEGRRLGDTTGHGCATGTTAAAGIVGTGKSASARRDVRAGSDIGNGRDAGARGGTLFQFWTTDSTADAVKGENPQRRGTPTAGSGVYNGEGERGLVCGENQLTPDTATTRIGLDSPSVSMERSVGGDISAEGTETSLLDKSSPVSYDRAGCGDLT